MQRQRNVHKVVRELDLQLCLSCISKYRRRKKSIHTKMQMTAFNFLTYDWLRCSLVNENQSHDIQIHN